MQNSGSPQLDLSGKLIIKVALGEDIRRIPIHNEDITYDELVLMMQRVYRGKLSTNDEITIKYKDEDGDLITIFDSSDLTFAIQCSRILKITLFVGGSSKSVLESSAAATVRRELQDIRDQIISLLDRLESAPLVTGTQALSLADGLAGNGDVSRKGASAGSNISRSVNPVGGKEFDPLSAQKSVEDIQNKVLSSFASDGNVSASHYERAATPDSISSVGSSASNQVRAQQNVYQPPTPQQQQQQQQQLQQQQQQQQLQQQQQQLASQLPPAQQQQQQLPYPAQQGYGQGQPGQMPQAYAGQPSYGGPQVNPDQQQQQQPQLQPSVPQQQGHYEQSVYNQYAQNYAPPAAVSQQGQGQPPQVHGQQVMYSQPGAPSPYTQAPGMPQQPQVKGPGYPAAPAGPGGSPNFGVSANPYSRGGYGGGYPKPTAGYPQ